MIFIAAELALGRIDDGTALAHFRNDAEVFLIVKDELEVVDLSRAS
jgi:hypothetical protein